MIHRIADTNGRTDRWTDGRMDEKKDEEIDKVTLETVREMMKVKIFGYIVINRITVLAL